MSTIEVIEPGPLTTFQDLGRAGLAHIGVPRSGAADRPALRRANRLVGNADGAAALEATLVGPRLRFAQQTVIAITGAQVRARGQAAAPGAGARELPMERAVSIAAGELVSFGTARRGARIYIAFAGGLRVPLTLGSAASDLLSGLGPAPLRAGEVLVLGRGGAGAETRAAAPHPGTEHPPAPATTQAALAPPHQVALSGHPPEGPGRGLTTTLDVALGPRDGWFTERALARLREQAFRVSPQSNRIGVRLQGAVLERRDHRELPSEGLVPGSIQVPADGDPIVLLADHPTTGGYPVIATLLRASLPAAAQLRPGDAVRFRVLEI